jgi:hypothetical protein
MTPECQNRICQIGDDITTSDLHRYLAGGILTDTRLIVERKFTQ